MSVDLNPEVSIIVLNYNGINFLKDCFDSLLLCTYPGTKLYMYDNNSNDESINFVTKNYPTVEIIRGENNGGYSNAYNEAVKFVTGKYAVFLNNDVKVNIDWIEHLVQVAENNPQVGALQPKLVWFNDPSRFEYAGASGGMMDKYGFPFTRGRVFFNIEYDKGQYNDGCSIFWASGAALFINLNVFKECGKLDESFVHHMEEIDLCWRLHLLGYDIRVVPNSVVAHHGGATITDDSFKKMYWNHRNCIFMLIKNFELYTLFVNGFVHLFFDYIALAQSLISLKPKRALAILKAHIWILLNLRTILKKRKEVQNMRKVDDKVILKKLFSSSIVYQYFIKRRKTYSQLMQII